MGYAHPLNIGLTLEKAECFEKLMLLDAAKCFKLRSGESFLELSFPGVTHEIGISEGMPPFERYLLCAEFLTKVSNANNGKHDEVIV